LAATWFAAAREDLDQNHAGAAVRAWAGQHRWRVWCDIRIWCDIRLLLRVDGKRVDAE
jgi:hypothetical protein